MDCAPLILVINDDEDLSTLIVDFLALEHFTPIRASSFTKVFKSVAPNEIEFLVINNTMPDGDAVTWLRENADRLHASTLLLLKPGEKAPDDEVCKTLDIQAVIELPCSVRKIFTQIQRMYVTKSLKRKEELVLTFHDLSIRLSNKEARYHGQVLELTASEATILEILLGRPEQAIPKEYIYQRAFGRTMHASDRSLDVHISSIRQKLKRISDDIRIEGLRRVGYMLVQKPAENATDSK